MTALQDVQDALQHLRKSSGYKNAKQANPKSFAKTELGICEQKLASAQVKLGAKVSLLI